MKSLVLALLFFALPAIAADVYVNPYTRKDGTYVEGHYRTAPNGSRTDNWGTQPNINPHTGEWGRNDPYVLPDPYAARRRSW